MHILICFKRKYQAKIQIAATFQNTIYENNINQMEPLEGFSEILQSGRFCRIFETTESTDTFGSFMRNALLSEICCLHKCSY